MLIIAICTGYSVEIIINAFTISSLFQIIIKLFFAIFSIKLSIILQISLLFLLLPIYLKFNTFDYFRTLLARFFRNFVPESAYEDLDPDRDDEFYQPPGDLNDAWYNHVLLSFIHFLITIRMFLVSEPILSIVLKFIAIRYFILNEYLFLAYTISLVFIFSRFIFLLSDKTLGIWKLSIEEMLENQEESPKITRKNILILTHWSLRYIVCWRVSQTLKQNNIAIDAALNFQDQLKDKFELERVKIQTTSKNSYCIKVMFFISMSIIIYKF